MSESIVKVNRLTKFFCKKSSFDNNPQRFAVIEDLTLTIKEGEVLALVGESGCGKTTLARIILKLLEPDGGEICYRGKNLAHLDAGEMQQFRRAVRKIFQSPDASLNPGMRIKDILREVFSLHSGLSREEADEKIVELLFKLGLDVQLLNRYPRELSTGQKKRISIARAFAVLPGLLVADEPLAGIDVSRQREILKYFFEVQSTHPYTMLFITHDLRLVKEIAERVVVMYDGSIMEIYPAKGNILHPYTRRLLEASHFELKTGSIVAESSVSQANGSNMDGCKYINQCELYRLKQKPGICRQQKPVLKAVAENQQAACHFLD